MSQTAAPDYSYAGEKVERVALAATDVRFDDRGLIPAVVQQTGTGEVLMVAWMNEESLRLTFETGTSWFWSRSRQELWNKGATSGNMQKVIRVLVDCDADTLVVEVDSPGPACHTGHRSCFFRELVADESVTPSAGV
jgi:phosphoribosyl-AMP cyclohydrolase/phosphoribosyl-ATP pyrophosphohydrolase/phosphoribosyl-AMP cyclohydrolase